MIPSKSKLFSLLLAGGILAGSAGMASAATGRDLDGDGILNSADNDIDNDGLPNGSDPNVDGGFCRRGPKRGQIGRAHV